MIGLVLNKLFKPPPLLVISFRMFPKMLDRPEEPVDPGLVLPPVLLPPRYLFMVFKMLSMGLPPPPEPPKPPNGLGLDPPWELPPYGLCPPLDDPP